MTNFCKKGGDNRKGSWYSGGGASRGISDSECVKVINGVQRKRKHEEESQGGLLTNPQYKKAWVGGATDFTARRMGGEMFHFKTQQKKEWGI